MASKVQQARRQESAALSGLGSICFASARLVRVRLPPQPPCRSLCSDSSPSPRSELPGIPIQCFSAPHLRLPALDQPWVSQSRWLPLPIVGADSQSCALCSDTRQPHRRRSSWSPCAAGMAYGMWRGLAFSTTVVSQAAAEASHRPLAADPGVQAVLLPCRVRTLPACAWAGASGPCTVADGPAHPPARCARGAAPPALLGAGAAAAARQPV